MEDANVETPGSWANPDRRVEFFEQLETCVLLAQTRRMAFAVYPFVLVSRFFKAFSAQPRLALVTSTLLRSATDIFHFGVVFSVVVFVFCLSAQILFGQELEEFANFSRSVQTVFRILLGDFDWERMNRVGRIFAGAWFWAFMWLVDMVLLNMMLAIIMDVYTQVKGGIGADAETLFSQASEIYRRWRALKAGKRMSLDDVLCALDPTDLCDDDDDGVDEHITLQDFLTKVPGLSEKQAMRILVAATEMTDDTHRKSQSLADSMLDIRLIEDRLTNLHQSVEKLVRMNEVTSSLLVSSADQLQRHGGAGSVSHYGDPMHHMDFGSDVESLMQRRSDALVQLYADKFDRLESRLEARMEARMQAIESRVVKLAEDIHTVRDRTLSANPRSILCGAPETPPIKLSRP